MNETGRRFGVVWFSQEKENTCFSATQIRRNKILKPSLMLNILKWKDVRMRVCVGMRVSIHVVVLTWDFWVNNKKRLIIVLLIYVDTGRCCWLLRVCEVFALVSIWYIEWHEWSTPSERMGEKTLTFVHSFFTLEYEWSDYDILHKSFACPHIHPSQQQYEAFTVVSGEFQVRDLGQQRIGPSRCDWWALIMGRLCEIPGCILGLSACRVDWPGSSFVASPPCTSLPTIPPPVCCLLPRGCVVKLVDSLSNALGYVDALRSFVCRSWWKLLKLKCGKMKNNLLFIPFTAQGFKKRGDN